MAWQKTIGTPAQLALQKRVAAVSLSAFQQPFLHQAVYNNRLQTTGGRYHLSDHHLDFNPKMADRSDFDAIIKHELCHYHLHLAGRGYQHRQQDFKHLLAAVGGSRYAPDIGNRRQMNKKYRYRCDNGHLIERVRRIDVRRYRCGQCRGRLHLESDLG
ncbi:SprT family protein [Fructobacillus sp. M1-13]|uniref:SprT family protein n=1 Tax=Fructobacillus papyriferae TaxID=2713171 RepID=A0ABS5QR45_9LACO|nr:SprT family protein [Fructobacillus papyriferae]MBS9334970.1 SprT family protein [Fructobacillus papyriferae]MCD2159546.1 SprT family protein [Fructobacillus papyriferae]